MGLVVVTPPEGEPLELAEAVTHLRLDDDAAGAEADLLLSLIVAAREHAETTTRRALLPQTWQLTLDAFPECGPLRLPKPPLRSVTSIKYLDLAGALQTLAPANYVVDVTSIRGRIVPAYGKVWPLTRCTLNAVTIEFVAGYEDVGKVPEAIKSAMKLLLAGMYEHREPIIVGTIIADNPAVKALLGLHSAPELS